MTDKDPILKLIDDGDVHDQLLLHQQEDERIEETIKRLLKAAPNPVDMTCPYCGRDVTERTGLADSSWVAVRNRVEDTDYRRTDLYCDQVCLQRDIEESVGAVVDDLDGDGLHAVTLGAAGGDADE